jgi:hypothetical protein
MATDLLETLWSTAVTLSGPVAVQFPKVFASYSDRDFYITFPEETHVPSSTWP